MPQRVSKSGSELFIVDNSDEAWKALRYLHDWCPLSKAIDIASGYFEIGALVGLYNKVTHKTLRISHTFGIEGRKLLRPEDDFDALRDFNATYEQKSKIEDIKLEYDRLLKEHFGLAERLDRFPGRVFGGKSHPKPDSRAVFFCYALPAYGDATTVDATSAAGSTTSSGSLAVQPGLFDSQIANGSAVAASPWSTELGPVRWYLYDLHANSIVEDPSEIGDFIRSTPATPRHCAIAMETLADIRAKIENHIKNTYLKAVQAPMGVKPPSGDLAGWYRLRTGDYRIRFRVVGETVIVDKVGHRRDFYED